VGDARRTSLLAFASGRAESDWHSLDLDRSGTARVQHEVTPPATRPALHIAACHKQVASTGRCDPDTVRVTTADKGVTVGFYLRKSVSAGPFRFNLSKSGIGMSTGVKGLRVGTGPRGAYVHAGRGGIYYRQSLGAPRRSPEGSGGPNNKAPVLPDTPLDDGPGNLEQEVEALVDATGGDLVRRISDASPLKKPSWFANPLTHKQRKTDWQLIRACPVFYELDSYVHQAYEGLVDAGLRLAAAPGRWCDASQHDVTGMARNKGNAGAGATVDRVPLAIVAEPLSTPTLNFEPLSFVAPQRRLVFLPDQLLVQQGTQFGAMTYSGLRFERRYTDFITPNVPPGVIPSGRTWQFVNKRGGPDQRYKVNPELAVLATWEMDIHHDHAGFQFHTAFTDEEGVTEFIAAVAELTALLPQPN
jgi:hypothetical protein